MPYYTMQPYHISVMPNEVMELLKPAAGMKIIDATFGCGGHARILLEQGVNVIAFDRDPDAAKRAETIKTQYPEQLTFHHATFSAIGEHVDLSQVDGILWDFGLCSTQLNSNRGFSFWTNDFLNMGMGLSDKTAAIVLNTYPPPQLEEIFRKYGDERHAKLYAKRITELRSRRKIETMGELLSIFKPDPRQRIHPATKVLQALRIEVNDEYSEIEKSLQAALEKCSFGTRLACISFHSGEDRIVKHLFRENKHKFSDFSKKPLVPSAEEIKANPASRSAKLRWGVVS